MRYTVYTREGLDYVRLTVPSRIPQYKYKALAGNDGHLPFPSYASALENKKFFLYNTITN